MNPLLPFVLKKLAAEQPPVSKKELNVIQKEIVKIKPKTEGEKKIVELVGKPQTKGQMIRNAIIGVGSGIGAATVGNLIDREAGKPIMTGRKALRAGVMGITFGAAMPAVKRLIDIEAAKRGKY